MSEMFGDSPRYESCSDEALSEAAKSGDREARNVLFIRHGPLWHRMQGPAQRLLRSRAWRYKPGKPPLDPEDIEQQTFVAFCDLLDDWEAGTEPFMRLLGRRLPGRLLHYVRDRLRPDAKRGPDPMWSHEGEFENEERQAPGTMEEDIEALLEWRGRAGQLPHPLRDTMRLRFYDDLSYKQIADIHGCTRRTVGRDLHAALGILRDTFAEEWEH